MTRTARSAPHTPVMSVLPDARVITGPRSFDVRLHHPARRTRRTPMTTGSVRVVQTGYSGGPKASGYLFPEVDHPVAVRM